VRYCVGMSSLVWLGLAVLLTVAVALIGAGPKGGKPVARTGLMKAARFILIVGIVGCAAVGILSRFRS
jgi:hypothetical protein